jgi:hypothetical protein
MEADAGVAKLDLAPSEDRPAPPRETAPVRVRGLGLPKYGTSIKRIQRARFLVPRQAERFRSPLIEVPPHGAEPPA